MEITNYYRNGIFRKNDNRPIVKCRTYEEVKRLQRSNFIECEVRKL